ncbi:MAG: Gfo/Idh/MocA family oxidoreductase [Planctomycetota bacterium]
MTIRWGLLGCGDIAIKRVADAIRSDPRSELVAACRRDAIQLEEFAATFEVPHRTTLAEDLIARDDLDAIYVATPVALHCEQTIATARTGKHVLVEKPMALSSDQCQAMIDACRSAEVLLGVAYYRRFYPSVLRLRELIDTGELGRPLSILAVTGNTNRFPADDWRVVRSMGGGGPLMDIGSHRLDLFDMLFGDAIDVHARLAPSDVYEAEESATLSMQFKGGVHGVLQCYFGTVDTPDRLEVIGTDGRVTIEDLNGPEVTIVTAKGSRIESHPPHENFHAPLVRDFTEAIETGRPPNIPGETGLRTNEVIATAYREVSGHEGADESETD